MPQWDNSPVYRRRRAMVLAILVLVLALIVWGVVSLVRAIIPDGGQGVAAPAASAASDQPVNHTRTGKAQSITLAFAGDTQAHGASTRINTVGLTSVAPVLSGADLAMLNLETAVAEDTSGLKPQPKTYTFVTGPRILDSIKAAGVDVVTAANNHSMDFGEEGMRRMLAVKKTSPLPIVGIGADDTEAWAPWTTEVKGRKVVVFGATDVLDDNLDWKAGPNKVGVAKIRDTDGFDKLLTRVREARRNSPDDVIVVYLHSGIELVKCPTPRQTETDQALAEAGADVVIGSHAHRLQTTTTVGNTAIAYGIGNFAFAATSATTSATGVLTVTVPGTNDAPTMDLAPAKITNGLPVLLDGSAKEAAVTSWKNLGAGCS